MSPTTRTAPRSSRTDPGTRPATRRLGHDDAVIAFLVILPLALILGAWIAARVSVRNSRLSLTTTGIVIDNHRRPRVVVPIAEAVRFEPAPSTGPFAGLRPATCVLVRTDGTRIPVRTVASPEAGIGVDALNARLATLRTPG